MAHVGEDDQKYQSGDLVQVINSDGRTFGDPVMVLDSIPDSRMEGGFMFLLDCLCPICQSHNLKVSPILLRRVMLS